MTNTPFEVLRTKRLNYRSYHPSLQDAEVKLALSLDIPVYYSYDEIQEEDETTN